MPRYDFQAADGTIIEATFSMNKVPAKIRRKGVWYERVFSLPGMVIDSNKPKTLGGLAEKNTRDMERRGDPRLKKKKKKERPWWRKDKDKPVSMYGWSKAKIKRYINTGKT